MGISLGTLKFEKKCLVKTNFVMFFALIMIADDFLMGDGTSMSPYSE